MIDSEVNAVIRTLREGGIETTSLHNHLLNETSRLFFMLFWANADAEQLARAACRVTADELQAADVVSTAVDAALVARVLTARGAVRRRHCGRRAALSPCVYAADD